jgi:hypothetical protein
MNSIHAMKSNHCSFAAYLLLGAFCVAGSAGCAIEDFKPSKLFSLEDTWPFGDDLEEGTPTRVVGAWTDTVMTKQGQAAQRGFGGRLAFYDGKTEKSIIVDGELVIYAFDETNRVPTDTKPTRRYVFPADQLPLRMSESELGATYSFWLPWDEAGGPQTEVSLICRFQPKSGQIVVSEQTKHRLPGAVPVAGANQLPQAPALPEGVPSRPARPTLESMRAQQATANGTQLASFESPAEPQAFDAAAAAMQPARQMTVSSIALPDNFQLRDSGAATQNVAGQLNPSPQSLASPATMQMQQPATGGAFAQAQQPLLQQQPQYQQPYQQQPYQPAAVQPGQANLGMPRVHAPQVYPFGNQVSAPSPIVVPQPLPVQPAPQGIQQQPGQPMPAPTSMQTTVSYPNQVMSR